MERHTRQRRRQHPESVPARVAESDLRDPTSELFPSERMDSPTVRLLDRFRSTGEFVVPAKNAERACLYFVSSKPRAARDQTYLNFSAPPPLGFICLTSLYGNILGDPVCLVVGNSNKRTCVARGFSKRKRDSALAWKLLYRVNPQDGISVKRQPPFMTDRPDGRSRDCG